VQAFAPTGSPLVRRLWGMRRVALRILDDQSLLVVSHFALYTLPILDRLADRPMVVHFQGPWALESAIEGASSSAVRIKRAIELLVYNRGTLFITLSRAFAELLHDTYGVPPDCIRVIPGGVSSTAFVTEARAAARERLGWPTDRPIILVVRRLVRRMGLEDAITAAGEVQQQVKNVLVIIAGTGPLANSLQAQISAAGLDQTVRLVGFMPDSILPLAYRAADITVVPSVALEGFGLIVAESLAAGTPVLLTPVGGLPETVEGLSPQCVLPEVGPRALAEGIIAAVGGRLKLPSDEECTSFARKRYHWPVVAPRVSAVYAEAMR